MKMKKHLQGIIVIALIAVFIMLMGAAVYAEGGVEEEPFTWDELEELIEHNREGQTLEVELTDDVICDDPTDTTNHIVISGGEVKIDLAGHTINRGLTEQVDNGCVFHVDGGSLTITDSVGGGVITGAYNYDGSAAYVGPNGNLTMTGGTISGNTSVYGGGIYALGNVTLGKGVVIENNKTTWGYGGGIYFIPESADIKLDVSGTTFRNNTSTYGGAIFAKGNVTVGGGAVFEGNKATSDNGGAIRFDGGEAGFTLTVTDATFRENSAASYYGGGAVYGIRGNVTIGKGVVIEDNIGDDGGGIRFSGSTDTTLTISGATIRGNTARYGGGIYVQGNVVIGGGTLIEGNTASNDYGGGIYFYGGDSYGPYTLDISDTTISANTAHYGGGIYMNGGGTIGKGTVISKNKAVTDYGGGIYFRGKTLTVSGATISENEAEGCGGGIYVYPMSEVTIKDCTITDNLANKPTDTFYGGGGVHLHADGNDWSGQGGTAYALFAGKNVITGNKAGDMPSDLLVGHDYYSWEDSRSKWYLLIDDALEAGNRIGIDLNSDWNSDNLPEDLEPCVFTQGYAENNTADPWAYFTSNVPGLIVLWTEDGKEARLGEGYILSYDANGGEGETLEGHYACEAGGEVEGIVAANGFTRKHYQFTGWNTESDGSGTAYQPEDPVKLTGNLVLYAQWEKMKYLVRFLDEDGQELQAEEVVYGELPVFNGETPAKEATEEFRYEFAGWNPELTAAAEAVDYTIVYKEIERTYGEPSWTWTGDEEAGFTAVAAFTTIDGEKEFTIELTDEEPVLVETPATPEQEGSLVYTATVTLQGKDYTDQKTIVLPKAITQLEGKNVTAGNQVYNGAAQKPAVVKDGTKTLAEGTDYTISYKDNKNVGTATVTVKGKGAYSGTVTKTFKITPASVKEATVSGITAKTYTSAAVKPAPVVKMTLNGKTVTLKSGTDYTVTYKNNTKVGTATVTITGKGNFKDAIKKNFEIKKASITKAAVTGLTDQGYDGTAKKPAPTVKLTLASKTLTLKSGTDYTVAYKNNTNLGTATVTLTGKGNFTDTLTKTFKVVPGLERVAGDNRYLTAYLTADELKKELGVSQFSAVIVADGRNFPDALASAYLAKVKKAPILLTAPARFAETQNYIKKNLKAGGTIYIAGGPASVPEAFKNGLSGFKISRVAGANRYETNIEILKAAGVKNQEIIVCGGVDFQDALSASATGRPVLLVYGAGTGLLPEQAAYLKKLGKCTYSIVGGTDVISARMQKELAQFGSVSRFGSGNCYDRSLAIAKKYFPGTQKYVNLAGGENFADGLAGGPLAMAKGGPLILTNNQKAAYQKAVAYVKATRAPGGTVIGGKGWISDKTAETILQTSAGAWPQGYQHE